MINLQELSVEKLLPESIRGDPDIIAAARALDNRRDIIDDVKKCMVLVDLDNQPEKVLDALAYSYHVDFYDPNLPKNKKLELIRNATRWHRRKGAPKVVEEVIQTVFDDVWLKEWFDYDGEPFMFKIGTRDRMTTYEKIKTLINAVDSVKNERSHLECLEIVRGNEGGVRVGHVIKKTLKLHMPMKTTQDKYKGQGSVMMGHVYKKKTIQKMPIKTFQDMYQASSSIKAMVFLRVIKFKNIGGI